MRKFDQLAFLFETLLTLTICLLWPSGLPSLLSLPALWCCISEKVSYPCFLEKLNFCRSLCLFLESRTRLSDFTFTFHFHALEKEMATRSSVLAWRIPGTGEPGGAAVYRVAQSRTRLKRLSNSSMPLLVQSCLHFLLKKFIKAFNSLKKFYLFIFGCAGVCCCVQDFSSCSK